MRKVCALALVAFAVAGLTFGITGCGTQQEVTEEPIIDTEEAAEEAGSLTGADIPLTEQPEDIVYVESQQFENIHFNFDEYRILPEDESTLREISGWLKDNEGARMLIEGHCDERGTNEYNMALGEQRALAARRYLVALDVDADRLSTISYGEERPLDPRSNEEAWSKNRRAHFVVSE